MKAQLSPLHVRPGARYRCFGDGLCCADVHAIGPLSDEEVVRLKLVHEDAVYFNPLVEANVISTREDGCCVFLGEQGCTLHEPMGGALKPSGCWRYPLGVTATPSGGRVVLEHRCPCSLMGERPVLDAAQVEKSLAPGGGVTANHVVEQVPLDEAQEVSFDAYVAIEGPFLSALSAAEGPEEIKAALGEDVSAFPPLAEHDWDELAAGMMALSKLTDGSAGGRFESALRWFGEGIKSRGGPIEGAHPRPWKDAFDRAEVRSPESDMWAPMRTFAVDALWSLFWSEHGHFHRARTELLTRLSVGLAIAERLRRDGVRPDRASAEAVVIMDLVGSSDWWLAAVEQMP